MKRPPGRPDGLLRRLCPRQLHAGGVAGARAGVAGGGRVGGGVRRRRRRGVHVGGGAKVGGGGVGRVDGGDVVAHQGVVGRIVVGIVGGGIVIAAAGRDEQSRTGNHGAGHHFGEKVTHLETP